MRAPAVANERVTGEASNPSLRDILRDLIKAPEGQMMYEAQCGSVTARLELRLISTEMPGKEPQYHNVAVGEYEGEPQAGHA